MAQELPLSLGKPGIQPPHGQQKEPLGKKAKALSCAATAEDAKQLSSIPVSGIKDAQFPVPQIWVLERTNPSAPYHV